MIKLYGAAWCKPCSNAKQLLTAKNVEFEFIDVDENAQLVKDMGIKTIPVLVKDNGDMLRGDEYNGIGELWEWVNAPSSN